MPERLPPEEGAFALALTWAERLRLPVQAVIRSGAGEEPVKRAAACRGAWGRHGLSGDVSFRDGNPGQALRQTAQPGDLLLVSSSLGRTEKRQLLGPSPDRNESAILFCPDSPEPIITRALVLPEEGEGRGSFLPAALALCRGLGIKPVVLALSRSEGAARRHHQALEKRLGEPEALATGGPAVDLDVVINPDLPGAVAQVARWRRCGLLVVPGAGPAPWWRPWRRPLANRLLDLSDALPFLVLPATGACDSSLDSAPFSSASEEATPLPAYHPLK